MSMKVCWNKILGILPILLTAFLFSCQKDTVDILTATSADNAYNCFSFAGYDYSVEMEMSRGEAQRFESEEEGYRCTLTATPRGAAATRASFDDIVWEEHNSKVGIYVVEHVADAASATTVNVVGESANLERTGNVISSSSVQILENIRHYVSGNKYYNKSVDVCAYFPYAEEISQAVALSNTSNSIVGIFNSKNENNVLHLPFNMKPTQTDKNIWFHDLMVSVREDINEKNEFGNIGKYNRSTYSGSTITGYYDKNGTLRHDRGSQITCDNVHLRMRHLFARFNICIKYDSRFEGAKINDVFVDGSKVYSYGQINLLTGEVLPGGTSKIDRLITNDVIHGDIDSDMVLCPCELTGLGEMVFHIVIDGVEYKCDLYKMMGAVEIKESYVYNLTLSFSRASTIIVNNGYGGTVEAVQYNPGEYDTYGTYGERWIIASGESDTPLTKIGDMARWLVVAPKEGWIFKGIYVNGEMIPFNGGASTLEHALDGYRIREFLSASGDMSNHYYCKLEEVNDKNTRYDVVYVPEGKLWYAEAEHIIQQFDGIYNNGFSSVIVTDKNGVEYEATPPTDPSVTIWKDLSGKGNDAHLANVEIHSTLQPWRHTMYDQTSKGSSGVSYLQYDTTQQSGWVEGGLKLDGVNDYVTFPAVLPPRDDDPDTQDLNMTIEMYIGMERPQPGRFPRILCEAEPGTMLNDVSLTTFTTHGYPSLLYSIPETNPSSTNVQFYSPGSNTTIYFMGCGHNNGYANLPSEDKAKLKFGPDGNRIMHLVFWYRGGYGGLTDMSIFSTTHQWNKVAQLGLGDPRNCLMTMLEYWSPTTNNMTRYIMAFYGDRVEKSSFPQFVGLDGVAEFKKLIETVFNNGVEVSQAEYEALVAENIIGTRLLTTALTNTISMQNHNSYLEDPFTPSERWACIGGRQNDYSRQFNGIVYSFIMYDKLLSIEDIEYNRQLHFSRFGAYKTDVQEGGGNIRPRTKAYSTAFPTLCLFSE